MKERQGIALALIGVFLLCSHAPSTAGIDDDEGMLVIGQFTCPPILIGFDGYCIYPCIEEAGPIDATFDLWVFPLEQGVAGLSFEIDLPYPDVASERVLHFGVDQSSPGDDVWEIDFGECITIDQPRLLLSYDLGFFLYGDWACTHGATYPVPLWRDCEGVEFEAPLFQHSYLDWPLGCFTNWPCEFVVPTVTHSWGTLKALYR